MKIQIIDLGEVEKLQDKIKELKAERQLLTTQEIIELGDDGKPKRITRRQYTKIPKRNQARVDNIDQQIAALEQRVANIETTQANLKKKQELKSNFESKLSLPLIINGETKTLREWIEEYHKLSQTQSTNQEVKFSVQERGKDEILQELAEITVYLEYFGSGDPQALNGPKQREERRQQLFNPEEDFNPEEEMSRIEVKNKELYNFINMETPLTNDNEKNNLLTQLRIIFGKEFLYPLTAEQQKRARLILTFLKTHILDISYTREISDDDEAPSLTDVFVNLLEKYVGKHIIKLS